MFLNIYLDFTLFSLYISGCLCYVNYKQFQGFDSTYDEIQDTTSTTRATTTLRSARPLQPLVQKTTQRKHVTAKKHGFTSSSSSTIAPGTSTKAVQPTTTTIPPVTRPLILPIVFPKFNCSEDERPFSIGTYEVPTQRDVVRQIQKTLHRVFNQYQKKALDFLQDIQQATRATSDIEKKCMVNHHSHGPSYSGCVKQVSRKCEYIMKSLVTSLEQQRADVSAFIDGTICNVTEMKADPVQLIKTLAMEQASLEFALPGFLRLLGSCSVHCYKVHSKILQKNVLRPIRHMTDQDLVVKHFLTKKSYAQLIN